MGDDEDINQGIKDKYRAFLPSSWREYASVFSQTGTAQLL